MPASWRVSAAVSPEMPPPTIAIREFGVVALFVEAKAASGPLSAAAPSVAPVPFRKSRRVRPCRSALISSTGRPVRSDSAKSAKSS